MIVDSKVMSPAFRRTDAIFILSRQPAEERDVGGTPARVFTISDNNENPSLILP